VSSLINQTSNDEKVNIVLCSLGKMFVGDLIETGRPWLRGSGFNVLVFLVKLGVLPMKKDMRVL